MAPKTVSMVKEKRSHSNHLLRLTLASALIFSGSTAINGNAATANTSYLKSVAITDAAGANAPPVAVINYSKNGDMYNFDASQSSDSDGSIASYKWNFGDGSLVEGVKTSYRLATGPTQITLTVADDKGGVSITQTEIKAYSEPFEIIADDANPSVFKTNGSWTQSTYSSGYYGAGYKFASSGTGSSTATWTISLPTSGTYEVFCYYTALHNRASNAPYIVLNNGQEIARVAVNQRINSNVFFSIGSHTLTEGSLEVVLTNGGNGYSIADAVKVVYRP